MYSIMMKSIQTLWYVIPAIASENSSQNIHHTREAGSRLVRRGYLIFKEKKNTTVSVQVSRGNVVRLQHEQRMLTSMITSWRRGLKETNNFQIRITSS